MKYKIGDKIIFKEPLMGVESKEGTIIKEVFGKNDISKITNIDYKCYFVDNFGRTIKVKHKDLECVTEIYQDGSQKLKYKVGDRVKFVKDWTLTDGRVMHAKSVWVVKDTSEEHYLLQCVENVFLFVMVEHKFVDDNCEKINTAPSIAKRINDKHNILNGVLNSDGSVDGEKLIEKLGENQVQVANGVVMNDRPQRPTTPASTGQEGKFKEGDKLQFVKEYKFPYGGSVLKGGIWEIAEVNILEDCTLLYVGGENSVSGKCGYNIKLPLEVLINHCKKVEDSEEAKAKGSHYEKAAMQPLQVMQRVMTKEQFKGFLFGNFLKYRMRSEFKGQHDSDEYKARQYAYWLEMVNDGHVINPSKDKVPYDYRYSII